MTIESTFYDTSSGVPASLVTEIKWAKSHPHVGSSDYGVEGPDDFKLTPHPTTPFTVNLAVGKAWGHGVFDQSNAIEPITCSAPAPGTTRWDLVAMRRNWTPLAGGPSALTAVEGGALKELPAGRENTPGTLDDQPLYLLEWTAGDTQPTKIVDLRAWGGNGGMVAADDLARVYLGRPGARVLINGVDWAYLPVGVGVWDWVVVARQRTSADLVLNGLYEKFWLSGGTPGVDKDVNGRCTLRGVLGRKGALMETPISMDPITKYPLATLPAAFRPAQDCYFTPPTAFAMGEQGRMYVRAATGVIEYETKTAFSTTRLNFFLALDGFSWLAAA